jgi:hypothetical protein
MIIDRLVAFMLINAIRLLKLTEFYQPTYNPRNYWLIRRGDQRRNSEDRVQAIVGTIDINHVRSYLDVGAQFGYYVFRFAEMRHEMMARGIEKDRIACLYAEAVRVLNRMSNVSFEKLKMTPALARELAAYDMISCMNVFHHIVHFDGFSAADSIMKELYTKCNKYFVFETGQFDEKGFYWSNDLSFMGEDPIQWIRDYLLGIGYVDVRVLAITGTHLSEKQRGLFLCKK